jgi:hypothetical protein
MAAVSYLWQVELICQGPWRCSLMLEARIIIIIIIIIIITIIIIIK